MTNIPIEDYKKLQMLLDSKDKANIEIAAHAMSALGIIPKELFYCMKLNNRYTMTKVAFTADDDVEISVDIGCVCDTRQNHVVNHLHRIHNLVDFRFFCKDIMIPKTFAHIKTLRELHMGYCQTKGKVAEVFGILSQLTNLEVLDMEMNSLPFLPDSIRHLKKLRELNCGRCENLRNLPDSIGKLQALRKLTLRECAFNTFPTEVLGLDKLDVLDLSNNKIQCLPEDIGRLKRLRGLYVTDNPLGDSIGFVRELRGLHYLGAANCGLEHIPRGLWELGDLKALFINSNNDISHLPEDILRLQHLETLNISGTGIDKIPEFLYDLPALKSLSVNKRVPPQEFFEAQRRLQERGGKVVRGYS